MRSMKTIRHAGFVALCVFLLAVLPILANFPAFGSEDKVEAVSSASIELPDQPSGDCIVLMNTSLHEETLDNWRAFFSDEDFPVIFEDIRCVVAEGDISGRQMAERFQAQLPENQMQLRTEDPTLLASKAEAGCIDVAVFSREMAEALKLTTDETTSGIAVIEIAGVEN